MPKFFHVAGIPGDSTDKYHQGWFDVTDYEFPWDGKFTIILKASSSTAHLASAQKMPGTNENRVFLRAIVEIYSDDEDGRMQYMRGFEMVRIERQYHDFRGHLFVFLLSDDDDEDRAD